MNLLNMTIQISILSGLLLFAGHNCSTASAETRYEDPKTLKASDILPPNFFKNDLYQVDQVVKNDGLMNTYSVRSKFGDFEVFSTMGLYKMVIEIEALQAMKEVKESDTFTKSLKKTGAGTVEGIKHLVTAPTESIEGAGKGLTNLFSRAGEAIFHSDPSDTEDNSFQQLIGFSKSKRIIAEKFHVDVYSTNKVLQDQLDTLAWADYAGGITISVAALPLGGPAGVVYSSSNTVRLLNEAIALEEKGNVQAALVNYQQTLAIYQDLGKEDSGTAWSFNNVGLAFRLSSYQIGFDIYFPDPLVSD